ncbi:MAG TPA: DUF4093 domain-containing protein [Ruminococcaceae bacterium]|nr:DUF4093 domain-containing protein [Oscillospiraceae bacterium]
MIHIKQTVVVEGKYDLIKLSALVDALIIPTEGFRIFKDQEKLQMLKVLAEKNGLLILTDSDAAGFKIRAFLGSVIPKEQITHVYIPGISGKEKRKAEPSKEGLLGVEGVEDAVLIEALRRFTASNLSENTSQKISSYDLYTFGLSGGKDSAKRRRDFLISLGLPARMNSRALVEVLNRLMTYDEFVKAVHNL